MAGNYLKTLTEVVRKPRHEIADLSKLTIAIERAAELPKVESAVQVVDFSRGGCAISSDVRLMKGEPVWLTATCSASNFTFNLPATVRWAEGHSDRQFSCGMQFEEELPMETLGELFLAGVLKAE